MEQQSITIVSTKQFEDWLGPGYRVYFAKKGNFFVILLTGGYKDSQKKDITKAQRIWQEVKDDIEKL